MGIEYKDSKRISILSPQTLSQSSGGTDGSTVFYVTSSNERHFVGQEFNTGHTLIDETINSVTFYMKHNAPNSVYKLVHLDSSDGKTDLEDVDLSYSGFVSGGSLVPVTFNSFTPFILSAGDKIGIWADGVTGGNSGNWIKIEEASNVDSNAERYVLENSPVDGASGTSNPDLKYTIGYGIAKPTNVQDNSILVEKDTGKRYWFESATPIEYETTFANSTGWTLTNTSGTTWNVSSPKLNWRTDIARSGSGAIYDLGSLDSYSTWLLRFELTVDDSFGRNADTLAMFGIHDKSDLTTSINGGYSSSHAQVQIQCAFMDLQNNHRKFQAKIANSSSVGQDTSGFNNTLTRDVKYYIEIKKNSATSYTVGYSTNSDYTTGQVSATETITLSGLRYLHFEAWTQNATPSYESWGVGWVENLKLYTDVTSVTPATWNVPSKTPAEIGDLLAHYDATVGVTASSNSVSAWADQSGNGNTLSSVSNPTRVEASLNGKDYLDFNSSKSMRATGLSETAPRPCSMVAVINPRSAGNQTIIRWSQSQYLSLKQDPTNTYWLSGGDSLNLTDSTLDGSWNAFFMDFKSNADGGTLQINIDTANAVSGDIGTNGTSGTTATLHVGINADNNNWYGNCRYAEIIIFDKVLTAYEKEQLYGHLKTKWGLP